MILKVSSNQIILWSWLCPRTFWLHQSLHSEVPNLCQLPSQDLILGHFRISSNWYFVQSSGIRPFLNLAVSLQISGPSFQSCTSFHDHSHVTDYWINLIFFWLLPKLCTVVERHLRKVAEDLPLRAGMCKVPLVFPCVWLLHLQLLLLYICFSLCACTPGAMLIYLLTAMVKIEFYRCAWAHMHV